MQLRFTENGLKDRKYPVSVISVVANALLLSEVREWLDYFNLTGRQQELKQAFVATKVCRRASLNTQHAKP